MKTRWIQRKGYDRLLIFFNGWGMDESIALYLQANTSGRFQSDVLLCYDYRSVDMPAGIPDILGDYAERTVVAWSLGVWAASCIALEGIDSALAINGTLKPISTGEGIQPDVFRATLDSYDEDSRIRFIRRMCGSAAELERFYAIAPQRSAHDQKAELGAIAGHVAAGRPSAMLEWSFTHALIGGCDLIFPPQAQEQAWSGTRRRMVKELPHFPFFAFNDWEKVCSCMED